jgi:integrase
LQDIGNSLFEEVAIPIPQERQNAALIDKNGLAKMAKKREVALTDQEIRNLVEPEGKLYSHPKWRPNLFIRFGKRAKTYYAIVRHPVGKPEWTKIGRVDRVTIKEAQEACGRIVERVRAGETAKEVSPGTLTFANVVENYRVKVGQHQRRWPDKKRRLDRYLLDKFGKRTFVDIKRGEVNDLLNKIATKSARVADQVLSDLQAVEKNYLTMGSVVADDYVQRFRGKTIPKRAPLNPRKRVLSAEELRVIWNLAGETDRFGVILKLLLLSGQRLTKVLSMRWEHLTLSTGEWRIPHELREKGVPEILPLPPQAITLIKSQPELGRYVFGSVRGDGYMFSLSVLKREFEAKVRKQLPGIKRWTLHDLRRTHRTLLSKCKVDFFVAESILGHEIEGVAGTYQRDDFMEEIPAALVKLAKHIETIVAGPVKQKEPRGERRRRLSQLVLLRETVRPPLPLVS